MKFMKNALGNILVMMGLLAPQMLVPVGTPAVIPVRPGKTRYFTDEDGRTRIDHKAMERNKYAPWGRGVAGGAAV